MVNGLYRGQIHDNDSLRFEGLGVRFIVPVASGT
jgi:hypothetical protein